MSVPDCPAHLQPAQEAGRATMAAGPAIRAPTASRQSARNCTATTDHEPPGLGEGNGAPPRAGAQSASAVQRRSRVLACTPSHGH